MWKLPFPEPTLSLPFRILSVAFVFDSDPLNLIFLIEKKATWMVWADISLERIDTGNGWKPEELNESCGWVRCGEWGEGCFLYAVSLSVAYLCT